jgi:hypothetical protein
MPVFCCYCISPEFQALFVCEHLSNGIRTVFFSVKLNGYILITMLHTLSLYFFTRQSSLYGLLDNVNNRGVQLSKMREFSSDSSDDGKCRFSGF